MLGNAIASFVARFSISLMNKYAIF